MPFVYLTPEIREREKKGRLDARTPGKVRKAFIARLAELANPSKEDAAALERYVTSKRGEDGKVVAGTVDDVGVLKIRFGSVCSIRTVGGDLLVSTARHERTHILPLLDVTEAGSIPVTRTHASKLEFPAGVILIVGKGSTGKSPFAHKLAQDLTNDGGYGAVRMGEPMTGYSADDQQSATDLNNALVACDICVVDSIKDMLTAGDVLTKGGISKEAFMTISEWSSVACSTGTSLLTPANGGTSDAQVTANVVELARTNATGVIWHVGGTIWEFSFRTGEAMQRVEGKMNFSDEKSGSVITVLGSKTVLESESRIMEMTARVTTENASMLARRTQTAKVTYQSDEE